MVPRFYGPSTGDELGKVPTTMVPDYEAARQIASLLHVVYEEWRTEDRKDTEIEQILKQLADQVNLQPYIKRQERLDIILKIVQQATGKRRTEGMSEFRAYLAKIGNQQLLEGLIGNEFLSDIQNRLSNKEFTGAILEDKVIKALQTLSTEELKDVLTSMANYDPKDFRERLARLGKLLEAKK
jgi:hypothetical protein